MKALCQKTPKSKRNNKKHQKYAKKTIIPKNSKTPRNRKKIKNKNNQNSQKI